SSWSVRSDVAASSSENLFRLSSANFFILLSFFFLLVPDVTLTYLRFVLTLGRGLDLVESIPAAGLGAMGRNLSIIRLIIVDSSCTGGWPAAKFVRLNFSSPPSI
ncbi:hypothetical protein LINPERHAP1_LOCUS28108, partial [Linum perenne]